MRGRWSCGVAFVCFVVAYFLGLVAITYFNH